MLTPPPSCQVGDLCGIIDAGVQHSCQFITRKSDTTHRLATMLIDECWYLLAVPEERTGVWLLSLKWDRLLQKRSVA